MTTDEERENESVIKPKEQATLIFYQQIEMIITLHSN